MGYRIDYQSVAKEKNAEKHRHSFLILSVCTLAILLLNTILKDQRTLLLRILFPGDAALTIESLDHMLTQLKAGAPFADAFQAFCVQVIAG